MTTEAGLKEKLQKIEALFAGAATEGERGAAQDARARIQAKLQDREGKETSIEIRLALGATWNLRVFFALCRHFGMMP